MKKFWCFLGVHEYVVHREGPTHKTMSDGFVAKLHYYDLRCVCCGNMKTKIL